MIDFFFELLIIVARNPPTERAYIRSIIRRKDVKHDFVISGLYPTQKLLWIPDINNKYVPVVLWMPFFYLIRAIVWYVGGAAVALAVVLALMEFITFVGDRFF